MLPERRFTNKPLLLPTLLLCADCVAPVRAEPASSDSDRLQKLEHAVELLQQRNAELEKEVSSLKKSVSAAPRPSKEAASSPPAVDGKSVATKTEVKEEKPVVFATAAASEFKLTLGGFIQTQIEAGDVSAFEGRFQRQFADDDIHSITAGVNYLLKGDDIKLLANYIHTWSDFRENNSAFEHS